MIQAIDEDALVEATSSQRKYWPPADFDRQAKLAELAKENRYSVSLFLGRPELFSDLQLWEFTHPRAGTASAHLACGVELIRIGSSEGNWGYLYLIADKRKKPAEVRPFYTLYLSEENGPIARQLKGWDREINRMARADLGIPLPQ